MREMTRRTLLGGGADLVTSVLGVGPLSTGCGTGPGRGGPDHPAGRNCRLLAAHAARTRGSYVQRIKSPVGRGGDGSAELVITVILDSSA